jgi:2-amino-4-hydroxy-6-hydroxymethyldihydropteridine diphosphokinase
VALGGNVGDVAATFRRTLALLERILGPLRVASLYRSPPLPLPAAIAAPQPLDQNDYLNTVAVGSTWLDPEALAAVFKALERRAGRRAAVRFAPRPLDLDLLLYGDRRSERPELRLPHPGLTTRAFVLVPLAELWPDRPIPGHGLTVREALARLGSTESLERLGIIGP